MKTVRKVIAAISVMLGSLVLVASCGKYNYVDELQGLGSRVETLEQMVSKMNTDLNALQQLVRIVDERGYITQVVTNSDGSYTIRFNDEESITIRNGRQGVDGKDGRDGKEAELLISVKKETLYEDFLKELLSKIEQKLHEVRLFKLLRVKEFLLMVKMS